MRSTKFRRSHRVPTARSSKDLASTPPPPVNSSRTLRAPDHHGKSETASFHPVAATAPQVKPAPGVPAPGWLSLLGPLEEQLGRLPGTAIDAVRDLIHQVVPPYSAEEVERATRSTVVSLARTLPGPAGRAGQLARMLGAYRAELEAQRSGLAIPGTPLRLLGAESGSTFPRVLEQASRMLATHRPALAQKVTQHLGIVREGQLSRDDDRWCVGTWAIPWPEYDTQPEIRVMWVACELVGESARVAMMRELQTLEAGRRGQTGLPPEGEGAKRGPDAQEPDPDEQAWVEELVYNAATCIADLEHAQTLRELMSVVPVGPEAHAGLSRHLRGLTAYLPGAFQEVLGDVGEDPRLQSIRVVMQEQLPRLLDVAPVVSTRVM